MSRSSKKGPYVDPKTLKKCLIVSVGIFLLAAACNKQQAQVQPAQNQQAQTAGSAQQQPQATSTNETASWQTYTSAQYGFKINIPADWTAESNNQGLTFVSAATKQKQEENAKNCTAENQYKNCMSDGIPPELNFYNVAGSKTDIQPGSLKTEVVNGIAWSSFIGLGMNETQVYEANLNGKVYAFNLTGIDIPTFNKILSSFQIIK